jgi:hypothetical protein
MEYLNKRNALRDLTDEYFEKNVSIIAKQLEENGFIYDSTPPEEIKKDWIKLCKKEVTKEKVNIPATCTVGMKIIRVSMPHFYDVENFKGISVSSLWTAEKLEKALRFNREYHSTPYVSEIIRSLSFTCGLGKITIYRPLLAKTVVNYFGAKSVLDVCVGWGGRMLGTKSLGENILYTGFEPCIKTYQGLCKIRDDLKLTGVNLYNVPAEKGIIENIPEEARFDLALTSPPYYNLEIYSDETTQSIVNYVDYETWLSKFIGPLVEQITKKVKYSCWSVKNFKTDKKYNLFDDLVKEHENLGWVLLDVVFSMKNSPRPGSLSSENKKSEENTYVFIKK